MDTSSTAGASAEQIRLQALKEAYYAVRGIAYSYDKLGFRTIPRDSAMEAIERLKAKRKPPNDNPAQPTVTPASTDLLKTGVNALVNACYHASYKAGWWHKNGRLIDVDASVPTKLCLIHLEISEAMEGHRKGLMDDKLTDRPSIEVELADAVIRIADLAGALGLDLGGAIVAKMAFNRSRADHKPEARQAAGGKAY